MTVREAVHGDYPDESDSDPNGATLEAIREGHTIGLQRTGEHVHNQSNRLDMMRSLSTSVYVHLDRLIAKSGD